MIEPLKKIPSIVIECQKVSKTYRGQPTPALDAVSFQIRRGQRVGLMGANGSGKSTLLKVVMNFLRPDGGQVRILGSEDLENARQYLGYVSEHPVGLENFTPRELFTLTARMHRIAGQGARRRTAEMLAFSGLTHVADDLVEGFSKGMMQRLQIALALFHDPPILLLDEPLSGLDPQGQADVRRMLDRIHDRTILLATHRLDEIEAFCDAGIILHRGRIQAVLEFTEMQQEIFQITADQKILSVLPRLQPWRARLLREDSDRVVVEVHASAGDFQRILHLLQHQRVTIHRIRSRGILEDLYLRYVRREDSPAL